MEELTCCPEDPTMIREKRTTRMSLYFLRTCSSNEGHCHIYPRNHHSKMKG